LYEVQKQTKLIYCARNQNSSCLWEKLLERYEEGRISNAKAEERLEEEVYQQQKIKKGRV
jgi:hypothetical protein